MGIVGGLKKGLISKPVTSNHKEKGHVARFNSGGGCPGDNTEPGGGGDQKRWGGFGKGGKLVFSGTGNAKGTRRDGQVPVWTTLPGKQSKYL